MELRMIIFKSNHTVDIILFDKHSLGYFLEDCKEWLFIKGGNLILFFTDFLFDFPWAFKFFFFVTSFLLHHFAYIVWSGNKFHHLYLLAIELYVEFIKIFFGSFENLFDLVAFHPDIDFFLVLKIK